MTEGDGAWEELADRIRRNMHGGLDGSTVRLMREAATALYNAERLLRSRDDFLVKKDLFSEYVATLNK